MPACQKSNEYRISVEKSTERDKQLYLFKGAKKIDSLNINDYNNDVYIRAVGISSWACEYNNVGGSSISSLLYLLLSVKNDKLREEVAFQKNYAEDTRGDETSKKSFEIKTELIKLNMEKNLMIKRTDIKNKRPLMSIKALLLIRRNIFFTIPNGLFLTVNRQNCMKK